MRLVAVSVVQNEADIIEAFVRHTRAWVDHHLIFDHESTDGTRSILRQLQAEGLPLTLFCDDAPGHRQQARSNHLTRLAAETYGADWILPLDADEILCGPDRPTLEQILARLADSQPASLPLHEYHASTADDPSIANPILRLTHCQASASPTRKLFIPRPLALDPAVSAGKGTHTLFRNAVALADQRLPDMFFLAHLAQRSPEHQVLRVIRAELQRLSRGRAAAGLDLHYRLGYQLLAEDPALFFATAGAPVATDVQRPIPYRGTPLRYPPAADSWPRVARALLPYLEHLATSHGQLADAVGFDVASPTAIDTVIRELPAAATIPPVQAGSAAAFSGFHPLSGWGDAEGPVPEAFLPRFHWGFAPATELQITADPSGACHLIADVLTYSEDQVVTVELNGQPVLEHTFGRINQKETITAALSPAPGDNVLRFRYRHGLVAPHDPRKLAVIFLSLRVVPTVASG